MGNNKKFIELMSELENIVSDLEKDDLDIEEGLVKFEQGLKLFRLCQEKLNNIEAKTKVLKEENGEFFLSDLED
ncbi:MAG: exodeoxyribonuclease VII small subunit [Firmicutes bacterium]|nr:exodeoxyribonuclease VII small subunit [Bacillota bacterium]